jgi:tripartite-type tricarboxylate transporter receptor subunit TctC
LPGFENTGWFGFMLPAGTPQAIVDKIHADTVNVLARKEMKDRLAVHGMVPVGNTPADFTKAIADESKMWEKVVKNRNLRVN